MRIPAMMAIAAALGPSAQAAEPAPIAFSNYLLPWEKLSTEVVWRGFSDATPLVFQNRLESRPDGSALFLGPGYEKTGEFRIEQAISPERTRRDVAIAFVIGDADFLRVSVSTQGEDLEPIEATELRDGQLPFFPGAREALAVTTLTFRGEVHLHAAVSRALAGRDETLKVSATGSRGEAFIDYVERTGPGYRRFEYRVRDLKKEERTGRTQDLVFVAAKTRSPGMVIGTEELFLDHYPVSPIVFQDEFARLVLEPLSGFEQLVELAKEALSGQAGFR